MDIQFEQSQKEFIVIASIFSILAFFAIASPGLPQFAVGFVYTLVVVLLFAILYQLREINKNLKSK